MWGKKIYKTPILHVNNGVTYHIKDDTSKWRILFYRKLLNQVDFHFSITEEIQKETELIFGNKPKLIRHGIDIVEILNKSFIKYPRDKNFLRIIYAGEISYEKGFHILMEAFKLLDKKKFQIDAIGPNLMNVNYIDLKMVCGINYLGVFDYEETLKAISSHDLLVLPTLLEGMPNVIKEAGLLKTPVLGSNIGGVPEILKNGERGFLFKQGDVTDLICQFQNISMNYNDALLKSEILFEHILKEYSIDQNTSELIQNYKNILKI